MQAVSSDELDRIFDGGGDVSQYMDLSTLRRPNRERQEGRRRVNVDMSDEVIARLDAQAARHDVPRQALIKMWLVERLDEEDERAARRAS